MAVIVPSVLMMYELAAVDPNSTPVAFDRPVPEMITEVLPLINPEETLRPVTKGAGAAKVNWSAADIVEMPFDD